MSEAAPHTADQEPLPVSTRDLVATGLLGVVFAATMALAVGMARPFTDAGLQAFEDPGNVWNSIGYIGLLLAFTFVILWLAKKGHDWVIRLVILGAVAGTVVYMIPPFLLDAGVGPNTSWAAGLIVGVGSAIALWRHPEWYVIDTVGVLVAAGAAALFGISLGIVPVLVLLVGLAVYDAIAVYRTKHMLALADAVMEQRLPVLLVIPKTLKYRFLDEMARFKEAAADEKDEDAPDRDALFMGLGDLVMPTILVVSAVVFGEEGWGTWPAWGAAVGTLVGYSILMRFVLRGRPQAGLPLLNGGAIAGFLVGLFAATGSLQFW